MERIKTWFTSKIRYFWGNWICAAGSVLSVTIVILMLIMLGLFVANELLGRHSNPYLDLVAFMMLPAFLILGILLVLLGNYVRKRREKQGIVTQYAPDLGGTVLVRKVAMVAVAGLIVLVGFGTFSYEAYHFTDSNQFCAHVCHTVMTPEATAYANSPHSNVPCVKCHIGPGASWFVRAKLSGLRQVVAVATNSYSRPIPAPVENLRPARETCEVCHRPSQFHGSRLAVKKHYGRDRDNTEAITANLLYVGGPDSGKGKATGIHWHVDPGNSIRYRHLDEERQEIVEVVLTTDAGEIHYLRSGEEVEPDEGQWRTMDCVDCHNRPTHIYELPVAAVDEAMAAGKLDHSIPYLKREAVRVLEEVSPTENTAAAVSARLMAIYTTEHPDDLEAIRADLGSTSSVLAGIIDRNIFPEMNITWGTYASNLGHFDVEGELDESGCFRCHDDELEADTGATITQDCDLCHNLLAHEETDWEGLPGVDTSELFAR